MLDYPGGPNVIIRIIIVLIRGRQKVRGEKTMLLVLKIEEGATSQRVQIASRIWKRQGNGFSSEVSKRKLKVSPANTLILGF